MKEIDYNLKLMKSIGKKLNKMKPWNQVKKNIKELRLRVSNQRNPEDRARELSTKMG